MLSFLRKGIGGIAEEKEKLFWVPGAELSALRVLFISRIILSYGYDQLLFADQETEIQEDRSIS